MSRTVTTFPPILRKTDPTPTTPYHQELIDLKIQIEKRFEAMVAELTDFKARAMFNTKIKIVGAPFYKKIDDLKILCDEFQKKLISADIFEKNFNWKKTACISAAEKINEQLEIYAAKLIKENKRRNPQPTVVTVSHEELMNYRFPTEEIDACSFNLSSPTSVLSSTPGITPGATNEEPGASPVERKYSDYSSRLFSPTLEKRSLPPLPTHGIPKPTVQKLTFPY